MGHTQKGCKTNKSSKDEFVKPIDKATEKGKVTGLTVDAADGQTGTSRTGTSKGNQMEWVTKQIKASKGQKGRPEAVQNPEPTTCNKFSLLETISETEESTNSSAEISMEARVEWERKKTRDAKGHMKDTAIPEIEDQNQLKESSVKKTQGIPSQLQTHEGGETSTRKKNPRFGGHASEAKCRIQSSYPPEELATNSKSAEWRSCNPEKEYSPAYLKIYNSHPSYQEFR